jgi:hypothetical protein
VRLLRANHNHFNRAVERGDRRFGYSPCFAETTDIMPREQQERFLVDYATSFLNAVWGTGDSALFNAALPFQGAYLVSLWKLV